MGGRALTEMQHDVRETQEALQECMDNPATLSGICLTEAQTPEPQAITMPFALPGLPWSPMALYMAGLMHWPTWLEILSCKLAGQCLVAEQPGNHTLRLDWM